MVRQNWPRSLKAWTEVSLPSYVKAHFMLWLCGSANLQAQIIFNDCCHSKLYSVMDKNEICFDFSKNMSCIELLYEKCFYGSSLFLPSSSTEI
jgi:hypothetical protein